MASAVQPLSSAIDSAGVAGRSLAGVRIRVGGKSGRGGESGICASKFFGGHSSYDLLRVDFLSRCNWSRFLRSSLAKLAEQPAVSYSGCFRTSSARALDCGSHYGLGDGGPGAGVQCERGRIVAAAVRDVAEKSAEPSDEPRPPE